MDQHEVIDPGTFAPELAALPFEQLWPQWNDVPPICKLPDEIFVHIVSISRPRLPHWPVSRPRLPHWPAPSQPQSKICATWAPLMFVCRRWYDIICSTPLLWNHINIYDTLNWFHLSVHRSGSSPLTLYFFSVASVSATLDALTSTITDRILKLVISPEQIDGPPRARAPVILDQLSIFRIMSRLEELIIGPQPLTTRIHQSAFEGQSIGDLMFSVDSFPALSVLKLSYVRISSFDQIGTMPPRLRVLSLNVCSFRTRVTFQVLLAAFRNCTALQELELIDIMSRAVDQPTIPAPEHPISFPMLHKLALQDRKSFICSFLACVRPPPTAHIHLMGDLDEYYAFDPISSFTSTLPRNTSHLCHLQEATIVDIGASAPGGATITTSAEITGKLTIHLTCHSFNMWVVYEEFLPRALRASAQILSTGAASRVHSLNITGVIDYVKLEDWKFVFDAFLRLKKLKFSGQRGESDVADLFNALHPSPELDIEDRANTSPMPCPDLTHLHLEGLTWSDDFPEVIASCASTRAACGIGFKRLHLAFQYDGPRVFQQTARDYENTIADAVGEGDLLFERYMPVPGMLRLW